MNKDLDGKGWDGTPGSDGSNIAAALPPVAESISTGGSALGLDMPPQAAENLGRFLLELQRWSQAINLTGVREIADMVPRHILDSLALVPHLKGGTLVDVGSGAGLPGLPLAMVRPQLRVQLIESNSRKAAFLRHVVHLLKIDNVAIAHSRVQDWDADKSFDNVVSRAFAPPQEFVALCAQLVRGGGQMLLMCGPSAPSPEELAFAGPGMKAVREQHVDIPGLDGQRRIVVLQQPLFSTSSRLH